MVNVLPDTVATPMPTDGRNRGLIPRGGIVESCVVWKRRTASWSGIEVFADERIVECI